MASILIFCQACGKQVPSSQTRGGLCVQCRVSGALQELRREHARLWRKRERYGRGGANLTGTDAQLERVERRMAQAIVDLIPDEKEAAETLKRELEEARRSRYDLGSLR